MSHGLICPTGSAENTERMSGIFKPPVSTGLQSRITSQYNPPKQP